ncbi:MAG: DMT family transporter [Pseudomonadota bacterium]
MPPMPVLNWLVLFAAGVSWGATQLFSKIAVSTGHAPVGLVLWQVLIGIVVLGALMLARRMTLPLGRHHLIFYAVCALLGTVVPHSLSYTVISYIPVGVASLLIATVPMVTLLLAAPLGIERASPRRVLGLGLGAAAVVLVVGPETSLPSPEQAGWAALLLIVSLSYAAENVYIARFQPAGIGAVETLMGLTVGALVFILPAVAVGGLWVDISPMAAAEQAAILGALLHIGAYLGLVWLIGQAGPVFASQIGYVVTLSGVGFGMIVLEEAHSPWIWLALVLMLAGLALVRPRVG